MSNGISDQITICEVSPRDGLPILCNGARLAEKRMYIDALIRAGLKKIECVAFTHPRLMPEHANAEKVMLGLKLTFMGAKEIVLSDTTGMADPIQVRELVRSLLALNLEAKLAAHFHNTRGTGMLNCFAAYEAGVRIFDTSPAGMSVTPYGALEHGSGYWNVPTEDLVHLFEKMGVKTGVDLDRLLECVSIGCGLRNGLFPVTFSGQKSVRDLPKCRPSP